MNTELKTIVARIERLEETVFGSQKRVPAKPSKVTDADTLAGQILRLRGNGFFKTPKSAPEVHAKLQSVYPCEAARVLVELFRLRKKSELRVTSKVVDGKKLKAYVG